MTDLVRREIHAGVARLTLADEGTRNSLSETMMDELARALMETERERTVAAVVVAAAGKVFSSGHNLKELAAHRGDGDGGLDYFERIFGKCAKLMRQIAQHRCAVIAEVDGLASAAGCQLVASCDLAYASPHASFCMPGVNIGLFCSTPMVPLSRTISSKHAMEMLLVGGVHDAQFAFRAGLVNGIVPQNELRAHVGSVAEKIAGKSMAAIAFGKRAFHEQHAMPLAEAYELASAVMARNMLDDAACEGIDAFIGKRQPKWPPLA